jgi:ferritin-like metal-binding protein YciE
MGLDLNELRDRLDNVLNQETADSLSEWINNKRNMTDEQIARIELMGVLDDVQSIMHELTLDEMDKLIDEIKCVYERYSDITDMRNGEKPE